MANNNELHSIQPGDGMELLDDDALAGVTGGSDPAMDRQNAIHWCPQRRGKGHSWQKCNQDFQYSYYRCKLCQCEVKKPNNWDNSDGSACPTILMRPGR